MRRVRAYDERLHSGLTQDEWESRAYVLIEEARLRCEQIEAGEDTGWLRDLHREVGLAGLSASELLPAWSRQILLKAAQVRSESPIRGGLDAGATLEVALGKAGAAVERCLDGAESAAHMHIADVHLIIAMDLIGIRRVECLADPEELQGY